MVSATGSSDYASYLINQLNASQQTNQATRKTNSDDNAIVVNVNSDSSQKDGLTISDAAFQALEGTGAAGSTQRPAGPPPGEKEESSFTKMLEEQQAAFDEALAVKLEAAGIDAEDVELAYDEEGNIIVTSNIDAENKALIEEILAEDAELAQSFQDLTDMKAIAEKMSAQMKQTASQDVNNGSRTGSMARAWTATGQVASSSTVASMYASQSTMSSNAIQVSQVAS